MPRRLSRRPGPEHPVLFRDADDIPTPVEPMRPRAGELMLPFAAVLTAADATALGELTPRWSGRTITVGGERRPPEALSAATAVLDDGTGILSVMVAPGSPRPLHEGLRARFVLATGTLRFTEGTLHLEIEHVLDLRVIARDLTSRVRVFS